MLILFVCILPYSNSFDSAWHLDDFPNIVINPSVHISDISFDSLTRAAGLFQTHASSDTSLPFRPVAYFSFALNWYAGTDHVLGYHMVNVGIHILCAWMLYILVQSLFQTPNLLGRFEGDKKNIALLSAVLWAIHPIQIQAVTYIVQRMTLLATLFYLSGLLCYIQARNHSERPQRLGLFSGCFLSLVLAMGSKENAVIFPLSLALIEIVFFNNLSNRVHRKACFLIVLAATVATGILAVIIAYSARPDPLAFINRVSSVRPFSLTERLLTEPRVVIGYLTQIFYPLLNRFSIEHFITKSTSILNPLTTIGSIILISGLLAIAFFRIRKMPVLSFSILFYFLNHIIESTVIPLELVFEHRNHLPSAFVFFPVAIAGVRGLRYYQRMQRRAMFQTCFAVITLFVVVLGMTTHLRNQAWLSEKTLWEDIMLNSPFSARPYVRMAWYYETIGQYDKSLELCEASLSKQWTNHSAIAQTLAYMAGIHAAHRNYEKALELYDRSITTDPLYIQALYDKAQVLVALGEWEQAKEIMVSLISKRKSTWNDLNLMGFILLKEDSPEDALEHFRKANQLSPQNPLVLINIGVTMSRMGLYQKANWFLKQANQMEKGNIIPFLCLLDNHIKAANSYALNADVNELFKNFSIEYIRITLQEISHSKSMVPISSNAISTIIAENLRFRSDAFLRTE
ncbi:MAG: tetratricopeptide repeat protein [Deltaproteobacteria bacterium]|nr:tetratricopeptide repeat protein [Deltaproteobacteria bacterium]